MVKSRLLVVASALLAFASFAAAQAPPETKQQFQARTRWWREARFGMFIHWGIYAVPADDTDVDGKHRIAEWFLSNKQMQVKDYEKFAAQFNPLEFDARRWVQIAKDAGMKYMVITSKHHDGFCMFDTRLTDYSIVKAAPFKRDPLKELAEECRKQGLVFCFYHSIMDWHHPDYLPRRPWEKEARPAAGADLNRYIDYMKGQLRELLTNYGRIGVVWFDGDWEHKDPAELRSTEVNAMIRSLQPGILINNRNRLPEDFATPEQYIPSKGLPAGLWETCMTMNDTWGYAKRDNNWKPAETLLRNLIDIASKGANFLLNVGPTAQGVIPEASVERLGRMGRWMKVNGESIYATSRSPFRRLPFSGRATTKGDRLYLHVFEWPAEGLRFNGLETKVVAARALDGGESLTITQTPSKDPESGPGVSVSKPARLDPIATVVELRLAGPPKVVEPPLVSRPESDGRLVLAPADAEVTGETLRYDVAGTDDKNAFFRNWTNAADYVTWLIEVPRAGRYKVEVTYACPPENAGSKFVVASGKGGQAAGTVKSTGSQRDFKPDVIGTVDLPAGRQTVAVRITSPAKGPAMNLRQVALLPAK